MDHYAADVAAVVEISTCATRSTSAIRPAAARRALRRAPRQRPRRQAGADRRRAAAHAEDAGQSGRLADRGVRRLPQPSRPIARSSISNVASGPFYGFNRPGAKVSQAVIENWWRQGMMGGAKAHYDGIKAFSETDFTEDLKRSTFRRSSCTATTTRSCRSPIRRRSRRSSSRTAPEVLREASARHGWTTHAESINADLLEFCEMARAVRGEGRTS